MKLQWDNVLLINQVSGIDLSVYNVVDLKGSISVTSFL